MSVFLGALLAALSGGLYAIAHPPRTLPALAFISWVPLLLAIARQTPQRAFLLGLLQGLVANAVGLYWLPSVVETFGGRHVVLCFVVSWCVWMYGAGGVGALSALCVRARRAGWPAWIVFPTLVAATELFYPLLFPSFTGSQAHSAPLLIQLADIGGPVLVGVPFTIVNVALAELVAARAERRPVDRVTLAVGAAAPLVAIAYGAWRMHRIDAEIARAPALRIGVVQANTPHKKMSLRAAIRTYRGFTASFAVAPELVVWPETALSAVIQRQVLEQTLADQVLHGPDFPDAPQSTILSGAMVGDDTRLSNAAVLFTPDGILRGVHAKVHPLAFGEYVPLADRFPQLDTLIPNAGRLTPGRSDQGPLEFQGHKITALICYEDAVPEFTDEAMRATRGELMIDLTNDAWFGRSTAAELHLGLAKFRSIEHRRFLVHAATSGVSAFIDPVGRTLLEIPLGAPAAIAESVRWLDGETTYERVGRSPRVGVALLTLVLAFVRAPRARRRRGAEAT